MQVRNTLLPGVRVIELKTYEDERGFFREVFRESSYQNLKLPTLIQYNHSRSHKNVLRGMHYQLTHAQGKLVSVICGSILDVVADICPQSPSFGQSIAVELSDQNHRQLYIPPGYAHGFITLSDEMDLLYACSNYYYPEDSFTINWADPTLNIAWPINNPILSASDQHAPFLADIRLEQLPRMAL